ncbi:hypothetical protein MLD38_022641 [Melastoma candidum]|uniref:Uncharacterized protein n=1 Tax=Melastoma candidum TaxID=119954 RepID=A0ACB9QT26_9MYRT|nr:hypothetical protein MLD38_022641 [Melastoma candidum]
MASFLRLSPLATAWQPRSGSSRASNPSPGVLSLVTAYLSSPSCSQARRWQTFDTHSLRSDDGVPISRRLRFNASHGAVDCQTFPKALLPKPT